MRDIVIILLGVLIIFLGLSVVNLNNRISELKAEIKCNQIGMYYVGDGFCAKFPLIS